MAGTQPPEGSHNARHWDSTGKTVKYADFLMKTDFKNISSPPGQSLNQTKQAQGTHLTQTQCFNIIRLKEKNQ